MPPKTESDHITLLLAIIGHSKDIDWNSVAETTGLYKSGKFVKQAHDSIKKKYAFVDGPQAGAKSAKATDSAKKRRARVELDNDEESHTPSKKPRVKKAATQEGKNEEEDEATE